MSKSKLNLLVDTLAYLAMVGLVGTGLLQAYHLPPGTGGRGRGGQAALTFLGKGRHEWGDIHFTLAMALLVLLVLHIILHWRWVANAVGQMFARGTPAAPGAGKGGSAALIVLGLLTVAAVAAPWVLGVEEHGRAGPGARHASDAKAPVARTGRREEHEEDGHLIQGRTTLAQAAELAGVSVERLLAELKLPGNTNPQARLGPLRREAGLSMHDVRALIERLAKAPKPK